MNMKEFMVTLYPEGAKGTPPFKVRISAANRGAAMKIANEMYPGYTAGKAEPA